MPSKTNVVFLLLMVSQTLHSIEEYYYSLWEVLAPARFISLLINEVGVPVATAAKRVGDVPETLVKHYLHETDPDAGLRAATGFEVLLS